MFCTFHVSQFFTIEMSISHLFVSQETDTRKKAFQEIFVSLEEKDLTQVMIAFFQKWSIISGLFLISEFAISTRGLSCKIQDISHRIPTIWINIQRTINQMVKIFNFFLINSGKILIEFPYTLSSQIPSSLKHLFINSIFAKGLKLSNFFQLAHKSCKRFTHIAEKIYVIQKTKINPIPINKIISWRFSIFIIIVRTTLIYIWIEIIKSTKNSAVHRIKSVLDIRHFNEKNRLKILFNIWYEIKIKMWRIFYDIFLKNIRGVSKHQEKR